MPRSHPIWILSLLSLLAAGALSTAKEEPQRRLVLTIVEFGGGPETEPHWRYSFGKELRARLSDVTALRLRGAGFGRRKIGLDRGVAPSKEQAMEIGLLVEAQRVLRGALDRTATGWELSATLLKPASGEEETFEARGDNFWELRDRTIEQVVERLGATVQEDEKEEVFERWTASGEALRLSSEANAIWAKDGPVEQIEALLRKAVEADGESSNLRAGLAWCYQTQEKPEEAKETVRRALEIDPENVSALYQLAIQEPAPEDEKIFGKILELDPEHTSALQVLGTRWTRTEGRAEEGLALLRRAKRISPMDGGIRAEEALALARLGKRNEAEAALREAVRLTTGKNPPLDDQVSIATTAMMMGKARLALTSLREVVAMATKRGQLPTATKQMEESIAALEERLSPVPIEVEPPRTFTMQELEETLDKLLTAKERKRIQNPLEVTPQMVEWARGVVAEAEGERATAEALFRVMEGRLDHLHRSGARSAREVFDLWNNPDAHFSCQEYGKLYVGLARKLGLESFFVEVMQDNENDLVFHACAAVKADGEWFLADPTYDWFGIPHRKYALRDDLQTIALHYAQPRDEEGLHAGHSVGSLEERRIAVKLSPESAYERMTLAMKLVSEDALAEAREQLDRAEEIEPGRWDVRMARGMIAEKEDDLERAQEFLEEALRLNPKRADANFMLGHVLARRGQLAEAREHYREALSHGPPPSEQEKILKGIARVNELIGTSEDSPVGRALQMMKEGDLEGAVTQFEEALEENPDALYHHLRLGDCLGRLERNAEAEHHLQRARELKPDSEYPRQALMFHFIRTGEKDQLRALVDEALELNPGDDFFLARLGFLQSEDLKFEQAIETFRKALAAGDRAVFVRPKLAWLLAKSGSYGEAKEQLELAGARGISNLERTWLAADAWQVLGNFQEAGKYLEEVKARTFEYDSPRIKQATATTEKRVLRGRQVEEELLEQLRKSDKLNAEGILKLREISPSSLEEIVLESELEPFFKRHRPEVLRELEEREITSISVTTSPTGDEDTRKVAEGIRKALQEGETVAEIRRQNEFDEEVRISEREWNAREDLVEVLQEPVFTAGIGSVTQVIEGNTFRGTFHSVVMVHDSRPGKDGTLDDEHVREAVKSAILRKRQARWMESYLTRLRERIRKEREPGK